MAELYKHLQERDKLLADWNEIAKELGYSMTIVHKTRNITAHTTTWKDSKSLFCWTKDSGPSFQEQLNEMKTNVEFIKRLEYNKELSEASNLFINNGYLLKKEQILDITYLYFSQESIGKGFELELYKQEPADVTPFGRNMKKVYMPEKPILYVMAKLTPALEIKMKLKPILEGLNSIIKKIV